MILYYGTLSWLIYLPHCTVFGLCNAKNMAEVMIT